ncbi:uncharacterized protein LOC108667792 [Hyalella azteca]|uniref:Uncharacterized protein LOC108667792 n=1 Tax=Hyalella azteca TaxID=294128 RepID=A0A8B7N936_HYAAZ|nr:uncharacterized protein LOC108667792 [Hyalella azteca]
MAEFPEVQANEDLWSLVRESPMLDDDCFLLVVRGLNMQQLVYPLLSSLPTQISLSLLSEALNNSGTAAPGQLSLITELCRTVLFKMCTVECSDDFSILNKLKIWLDKMVQLFVVKNPKTSGYALLHMFELLHLTLKVVTKQDLEKPCSSPIYIPLQGIFRVHNHQSYERHAPEFISTLLDTCAFLMRNCEALIEKIDVETWMQWTEVDWSPSLYCVESKGVDVISLQRLIAFSAHCILKISSLTSKESDGTLAVINAAFLEQKALMGFIRQVAIDANHDPDLELPLTEILEILRVDAYSCSEVASVQSNKRKEKLLRVVIETSNQLSFFASNDAADIILENASSLSASQIEHLLNSFMLHFLQLQDPQRWQKVLLELCRSLDAHALRRATMTALQRNPVSRDWLSTPEFGAHVTALCNILAIDSVVAGGDSCQARECWWTCVQRPHATVTRLVLHAVAATGVAAAVAAALDYLAPLCRARHDSEGTTSNLTSAIGNSLKNLSSSSETSAQHEAFIKFFDNLCAATAEKQSNSSALIISEVTTEVLLPGLRWQPSDKEDVASALPSLVVPIAMLQSLLRHCPEEFFSGLPANEAVSLTLFLATSLQNCRALLSAIYSRDDSVSKNLTTNGRLAADDKICNGYDHSTSNEVSIDFNGSKNTDTAVWISSELSSSQTLLVLKHLSELKELLSIIAVHLATSEEHVHASELLLKYFQPHSKNFSYSCMVILRPIFATTQALNLKIFLPHTKTAQLIEVIQSASTRCATTVPQLSDFNLWSREEWLHSLCQILPEASADEWNTIASILTRIQVPKQGDESCESEVGALILLWDALQLLLRQPFINVTLFFKNFTSAATQILRWECAKLTGGKQLLMLCQTFLWWCQQSSGINSTMAALGTAHTVLLLLRILELVRELVVGGKISNGKPCEQISKKTGKKSTDNTMQRKDDRERVNSNDFIQNSQVSSLKVVPKEEARKLISMLVVPLVKYFGDDDNTALLATHLAVVLET